ncbi:endo alpha-1,4 polygalactosaminidase [Curtobacterium caseinilyticum]|uniref:Endo alpha-1,4 polygalactosaminidase n=1 Tax=Curtobacterium caseinilyticum TaxID=3055137 RepID=A0ABT7TQ30_9MICO|nr:endo alpha-1,4 polygalactosaminidase [Curtobacterium caseinilyticum]MDM7891693.1 endo alpha-1,4 polygalactosaminidase [Curtobacterium caseinilyticum]
MRTRPVLLTAAVALVTALAGTGCAAAATPAAPASSAGTRYTDLPTSGRPDYQLGGGYTPAAGVTIVERDSTDRPAAGRYSICYVNGFQTQPGSLAEWQRRAPSALLRDGAGTLVSDPGWPDEVLLDTRTAAKRAAITKELTKAVVRCADRGFDAVEFDNLDSWTRSGKRLTRSGNLALAAALVRVGHEHRLAVGQKNTPQLGKAGRQTTGFDFVVAEECVQYDECSAYTAAYGKRVIDIEYSDTLHRSWASVCGMRDRPAMTILRDRDLVTPADDEYVFEHC